MHEKMKSLHKNNTYELMELPKGKRALKNKCVLKRKPGPNSSQPRYKARLVVKGFSQKKGIDFEEIFSLVVKMSSIRVVLGLDANMNLEIEQLNVKIVFLHGDLEEEIYMEQPEGFTIKGKEHLVCQLKKAYMVSSKHRDSGTRSLILSWLSMGMIELLLTIVCL